MAIQYSDGFDRLNAIADLIAQYPGVLSNTLSLVSDGPFARGNAVRSPANQNVANILGIPVPVPVPRATIGCSFHVRIGAYPTTVGRGGIVSMGEGSAPHVTIYLSPTGVLTVGRSSLNPALLLESGYALPLNTWLHMEVKAFVHNSTGFVTVRVNGQQVAHVQDVDTQQGGVGVINVINLLPKNNTSTTGIIDIDNLVIWDETGSRNNDYPGDCEVVDLLPSADGATQDWSLSSGSDAASLINGAPDGDSSYIESDVVGAVAEFEIADLPVGVNRILSVQPFALAKKDDAVPRTLNLGVSSGGTEDDGTAVPLGLGYTEASRVIEVDPATGTNWQASAVDALKLRLKVAS